MSLLSRDFSSQCPYLCYFPKSWFQFLVSCDIYECCLMSRFFCFICKMQSQVWSAVFTFVYIMVANFFNCLPYFPLCNVLTFLSDALFYFSQFCYLSVHILMSSVSIYIHVSICPPVSIFLPVSISIFCLSQFRFFCLSRFRFFCRLDCDLSS